MLNKLKNYPISFSKIIFGYSIFIAFIFNSDLIEKLDKYFLSSSSHNSVFEIFFFFIIWSALVFFLSILLFILGGRYLLKPLVLILLLSATVISYYKQTYGIQVNQGIIESLLDAITEGNTGEIKDLLHIKLFISIVLTAVIPFIPLWFIKIHYPSLIRECVLRLSWVAGMLIFLVVMIAINYKDTSLTIRDTRGINKEAIPHYAISSIFSIVKKSLKTKPQYVTLDNNPVILSPEQEIVGIIVVGETARADRMSLNGYNKKTNPLLEKQQIINYTEAYSCGTLTKISVPCMFFLGDYNSFSETKARYQQNLLNIVEKAGGDVLWLENNSSCKNVCENGTKRIDIITDAENTYDEVLVKITEDIVLNNKTSADNSLNSIKKYIDMGRNVNASSFVNFKNSKKKRSLIVLHTMGSHGPKYHKRFPKEFEKFKPSCKSNNPQECTQEELSNAFDNTILYTDFVVDSLIEILKKQNKQSFLIYASDHGESLGEFGLYLHGVPVSFAPKEQVHIPWVIWYSDKYKKNNKISFVKSEEKITHEFFPHTILKSLKIKSTTLREEKSLIRLN